LAKIKGDFLPEPKQDNSFLKTVSMVAAMGAVLCRPGKETNDFQSRILKAGLGNRGLIMPDNWNELPEEEKTRRLAGAIGSLKD
jgi:hypothetical protein